MSALRKYWTSGPSGGIGLIVAVYVLLGTGSAAASQLGTVGIGLPQAPTSVVTLNPSDFERLYPRGLRFQIKRNGEPIGFHHARVTKDGDVLRIENHTVMNTRVFFSMFPYRLEYTSTSRWRGGRFLDFAADVEEQGEIRRISVTKDGNDFILDVEGETRVLTGEIVPSPHWLSIYVKGAGLLHGLTGDIWDIAYDHNDTFTLRTSTGEVEARKYTVVNAELTASEWYDDKGRWLAMHFEAPDGSTVNYECMECGLPRDVSITLLGE